MSEVLAAVIKTNGDIAISRFQVYPGWLEKMVGGEPDPLSLLANDVLFTRMGADSGLYNPKATRLWGKCGRNGQEIYGDVVVIGIDRETGTITDMSEDVSAYIYEI